MHDLAEVLSIAEEPLDAERVARIKARIHALSETMADGRRALRQMFQFERDARTAVRDHIRPLVKQRKSFKAKLVHVNYPRLSLEPLNWRNARGYPKLALFRLDSPIVEFAYHVRGESRRAWGDAARRMFYYYDKEQTYYPPAIGDHYTDVIKMLKAKATQSKKTTILSTRYTGVIPATTRAKIRAAQKEFKNEVYILAEVKQWDLSEKRAPVRIVKFDPIVVAFDERTKCLYIIDTFDLTPVEEFVRREFTL